MSVHQYGSTNSRIPNKTGERKYPGSQDKIKFQSFQKVIFHWISLPISIEGDYSHNPKREKRLFAPLLGISKDIYNQTNILVKYISTLLLKIRLYLARTQRRTLCLESTLKSLIGKSAHFRSTNSTMNDKNGVRPQSQNQNCKKEEEKTSKILETVKSPS